LNKFQHENWVDFPYKVCLLSKSTLKMRRVLAAGFALWSAATALPNPVESPAPAIIDSNTLRTEPEPEPKPDPTLTDPLWLNYGLNASAEYKYFHEPGRDDILGHYDSRFFKEPVGDSERAETLTHMIRAYLNFFNENKLDTWIAHGTLLGWWWNGKVRSHCITLEARILDYPFVLWPSQETNLAT
jgi:hypothetical protein